MEPLDDRELGALLEAWQAPGAPAGMRPPRRAGGAVWNWLWRGTIRVPVPVLLAAVVVFMASVWWAVAARRLPEKHPPTVTFTDFQPVKELKMRVIRSEYAGQ
jgi:hypothetical protein